MPFISINQLKPGMILSADVIDTNGRMLLSKGKAITANHMTTFKMWGVAEVSVELGDGAPADTGSPLDPGVMRQVAEKLKTVFQANDLTHPAVAEIFRQAVMLRSRRNDRSDAMDSTAWEGPPHSIGPSGTELRKKIRSRDIKLPEIPAIIFKLNDTMADPFSSADDIARVISKSPGLSALLLRIVNSAFYGFPSRIDSVARAVTIIGSKEVSALAVGISTMEVFKDIPKTVFDMRAFTQHSLSCGVLSRILAASGNIRNTEQMFVSGLLHDIGRLVIFKYLAPAAVSMLSARSTGASSLIDCEKITLGCRHTDLAADLFEKWKFPVALTQNVVFHHRPAKAQDPVKAGLVHIADMIAHSLGEGKSGEWRLPTLDIDAWEKLRLSPQALSTIIPQAIHHLDFLTAVFQGGGVEKMPSDIGTLKARIARLEDNRRYIQNALEMVLSLEDFYAEVGGDSTTLDTLLPEAKRRIYTIIPFDILAFYMVDDADSSFRPAFLYPDQKADLIRQEVDFMIDEGYFAWAIRERRGVTLSSRDHSRQYLLHVIANHNQIKGMFGGLLPIGHAALPDTAMTLLSIILLHVANAAESMAHTDLLKNQSMLLETQVAERTRELMASQQELESAIHRANALAEDAQAASKAKGDFLAKMSHELRTPLNGIIGMTEVALSTNLEDSQRRIVEIIGRESFSLLRQINDVLDFTKIEAGKLELEQIDFDLRSLVEEVGESFIFQTTEKGVDLNVFIDPNVPDTLIGDPVRLRQILLNLTGNAVKFTHVGEILIEAQLERQSEDRAVVRFAVVDTGIGIEPEKVAHIFSSFSQADNSTTRQYGGTGLGTTISKQLVELMGGRIRVDSRPGEGSAFWFSADFSVHAVCRRAVIETDPTEERPTLLVVDNNATSCRIISTYLNHLGMSVVTASDGAAALAALDENDDGSSPVNAIITDTQPSGADAVPFQDHIRRMPAHAKTPIIVTSSLKTVLTGEDGLSLGFDGALAKPVKIGELKAIVEQVTGDFEVPPVPFPKKSTPAAGEDLRPGHSGQVLVADDYLVNQQVAYMHLTAAGFTVDLVENGQQALEAFSRIAYDIILMDVQMPVLNGLDTTERIREIETARADARHTPIIALTANTMKGDEQKCLDAGMDGYLTKPVHRHQLLKTVQQWIDLQGSREKSRRPLTASETSNKPSDTAVVVMDIATAMDEFGDADTVKRVAGQLIDNVTGQLQKIRQAITDHEREGIRKDAHAIKGGAATLEAASLSGAAAHLEKISPDADPADLKAGYNDLEKQFFLFRDFISQWKRGGQ